MMFNKLISIRAFSISLARLQFYRTPMTLINPFQKQSGPTYSTQPFKNQPIFRKIQQLVEADSLTLNDLVDVLDMDLKLDLGLDQHNLTPFIQHLESTLKVSIPIQEAITFTKVKDLVKFIKAERQKQ